MAGSLPGSLKTKQTPLITETPQGLKYSAILAGKRLDYFVSGWGTGGTITGTGEAIKMARSDTKNHRRRAGKCGNAFGQRMVAAQDPGLDAGFHPWRS